MRIVVPVVLITRSSSIPSRLEESAGLGCRCLICSARFFLICRRDLVRKHLAHPCGIAEVKLFAGLKIAQVDPYRSLSGRLRLAPHAYQKRRRFSALFIAAGCSGHVSHSFCPLLYSVVLFVRGLCIFLRPTTVVHSGRQEIVSRKSEQLDEFAYARTSMNETLLDNRPRRL